MREVGVRGSNEGKMSGLDESIVEGRTKSEYVRATSPI